jgi:hypothetical protein
VAARQQTAAQRQQPRKMSKVAAQLPGQQYPAHFARTCRL